MNIHDQQYDLDDYTVYFGKHTAYSKKMYYKPKKYCQYFPEMYCFLSMFV